MICWAAGGLDKLRRHLLCLKSPAMEITINRLTPRHSLVDWTRFWPGTLIHHYRRYSTMHGQNDGSSSIYTIFFVICQGWLICRLATCVRMRSSSPQHSSRVWMQGCLPLRPPFSPFCVGWLSCVDGGVDYYYKQKHTCAFNRFSYLLTNKRLIARSRRVLVYGHQAPATTRRL